LVKFLINYPILASVFATVLAVVPLFKFGHHVIVSKRTFRAQALDLIFRSYSEESNLSHRLIIEQMFQSNFGIKLNYEIITLLLTLPNPTETIELYKTSKNYLVLGNQSLEFKTKFQCPKRRKLERFLRPLKNLGLYGVFGIIGGVSASYVLMKFNIDDLFITNYFIFNGVVWFLLSIVSIISIRLALAYLTDKINIGDAERLKDKFHSKQVKKVTWCY